MDPGGSHTFQFRAEAPGVYLYHCSAAPILNHIANGMYGAMIVEPRKGFSPAREFVVVQSEIYGEPDSQGLIAGDTKKMSEERPDFVIFDGAIMEFMVKEQGDYTLVDHAIARVYKGAVAMFRTEGYKPAPRTGAH